MAAAAVVFALLLAITGSEGAGNLAENFKGAPSRNLLRDFIQPSGLSPPVQKLCDDYWEWRMKDMPEFATYVGYHDYNHLLDDLTFEAYDRRFASVEEFMAKIKVLEPTLKEHFDILNIDVLKGEMETYIGGFPYKNFVMPLNYMEGPQTDLVRLITWMPQGTFEDFRTIIRRLARVRKQFEDIVLLLEYGVANDILPHKIAMNRVPEQMEAFLVSDPDDSPLFQQFFQTLPSNLTSEETEILQIEARVVIKESVTPAFRFLHEYLTTQYKTRPEISVSTLPDGENLYRQLMLFHTGDFNATAEQIHLKGYEEVKRINGLMQETVSEMGYNLTTEQFSNIIKNDPANFYTTAPQLMDAFENIVYNIAIPALPLIFKNIPKAKIILVENPTPDRPTAFFQAASYDGSRPGIFFVNTYDPQTQPKYEMLTLSLHEGDPGHHLQTSHCLESANVPYFRGVMEDRNYAHAPSRFPIRTYYMEGWALYAESLGFDMDLYDDLLERYGHYSDEMFRACRLVIDTGIHAYGWTQQRGVDFMLKYTAMTEADVQNEVNRYVAWPGQALGYKWGQLQFKEFRQAAEDKLGDLFNLKDFHDVLLESIGSMSIVGEEVERWVDSVLHPPNSTLL